MRSLTRLRMMRSIGDRVRGLGDGAWRGMQESRGKRVLALVLLGRRCWCVWNWGRGREWRNRNWARSGCCSLLGGEWRIRWRPLRIVGELRVRLDSRWGILSAAIVKSGHLWTIFFLEKSRVLLTFLGYSMTKISYAHTRYQIVNQIVGMKEEVGILRPSY